MTDPRYSIECKTCHGTGRITSPKCPYPSDVECDCAECIHSGDCGTDEPCETCDGTGEVTENEYKENLKWMEV